MHQKTGVAVPVPNLQDPAEIAYLRLLAEDDAALDELDRWTRDPGKTEPTLEDTALERAVRQSRVEERLATIQKAYETFFESYPNHARARLAYGSFLNDVMEEDKAFEQWEKSRQLDPSNPAVWNNLGNYYGHNGPVTNAFAYYDRAIALDPTQSLYYRNLATTLYLFRRDGSNYYQMTADQVMEKVKDLYGKALVLAPNDFILATEIAQTFYGIKPPVVGDPEADRKARVRLADQAVTAWNHALRIARDDKEAQGMMIHLARVNLNAGRLPEARAWLDRVTDPLYAASKRTLSRKLERAESVMPPAATP